MDEMNLSFRDILLKVLIKWRMILIMTLLMGGIFGLVGIMKGVNNTTSSQEITPAVTMNSLKSALTESAQEDVEMAVEHYLTLKELLEAKELHFEHSIKLKSDYKKVPLMSLTYRVKANEQNPDGSGSVINISSDIVDLCQKKILNKSTYEELLGEIRWDADLECVQELIEVQKSERELFTIRIVACSQEECEVIASVMKRKVQEAIADVGKNYKECVIELVDEQYSESMDMELLRYKQWRINEIVSIKNEMLALDDGLGEEGIAYYEALINGIPNMAEKYESEPNENLGMRLGIQGVKYALLGVILGGIIVVGYILLKYFISNRLRNYEELATLIGIGVFGVVCKTVQNKKPMKILDEYIYKLFGVLNSAEGEQKDIISSNIRVAMKKKSFQRICLVSSSNDEDVKKLMGEINAMVANDFEAVHESVDVLKNAEMLERMLQADCVVVVEKENISRRSEIKRIAELCEIHKVPILGGVVFKRIL